MSQIVEANPFFEPWSPPFELPPFERIEPGHFAPAFERGMAEHKAEVAAIAQAQEAPTFDNTLAVLELSGRLLRRVSATFFNLSGAHTNDALQAIEREIAPVLAKHRSDIFMNEALFGRVASLYERRDVLALAPEQARVLDRYHTIFVRAGARLRPDEKRRLGAILERLATLGTQFSQNVLADE